MTVFGEYGVEKDSIRAWVDDLLVILRQELCFTFCEFLRSRHNHLIWRGLFGGQLGAPMMKCSTWRLVERK